MYELYQAEWCPYSHRVRQRLTELGVDFIARQVPADKSERNAMFERTGVRGIPVLVARDKIITEPKEILDFLEQQHPRTADSDKHRRKDRDPETLQEREEVREELP